MSTKTIKRILLSNRVTEEDLVELDACQEGIDAVRPLLPADITPENIAAARKLGVDVSWLLERISYGHGFGTGDGFGLGYGDGDGDGYGDGYGSVDGFGFGFGLGYGDGDGYGDGYGSVDGGSPRGDPRRRGGGR